MTSEQKQKWLELQPLCKNCKQKQWAPKDCDFKRGGQMHKGPNGEAVIDRCLGHDPVV
jgi:hypothetical protein